jgi:transcriptional regulator with XRE-family HTH domain
MLHSLGMRTLGQFIVERRKELGLAGREVVAEVRNSDGRPISIPFLVDLEHDRRKPSDDVLEQLAKVLKVDSDMLYFLAGRFPADLTAQSINSAEELAAAWKAFRREVRHRKKP